VSTVHINRGPGAVKELSRTDVGVCWCFGCRKRLRYEYVVHAYDCDPMDDWYGPWGTYECTGCGDDRALFPGRERVG
jgi:hypothetical protein